MTDILSCTIHSGFHLPQGIQSIYFSLSESFIGDVSITHSGGVWNIESIPVALFLMQLVEEVGASVYTGGHSYTWIDPDSDREFPIKVSCTEVAFDLSRFGQENIVINDVYGLCGQCYGILEKTFLSERNAMLGLGPVVMDNRILRSLLTNA